MFPVDFRTDSLAKHYAFNFESVHYENAVTTVLAVIKGLFSVADGGAAVGRIGCISLSK